MNRRGSWWSLGWWLLTPCLAAGQQPGQPPPPDPLIEAARAARAALTGPAQRTQMYEDVEILRRILNRELHPWQATRCADCHQTSNVLSSAHGKLWDLTTGKM